MKSPSGVNYPTANAHAGSPYQSAQQQQNAGNIKLALLSKSGGSKSGGNRRNRRGGASQIQVSSGGNTLYKSVGGVTPNDIVYRNTVAGNAGNVQSAGDIVPLAKPIKGGSILRKNKSRKNKSRKNKSRKNKSRKM